MPNYYSEKLSAERLQQCYEIAPARIKQYHKAEINYVIDRITQNDLVLDIGCGYGRVFHYLAVKTTSIVGVDISYDNLFYARQKHLNNISCNLLQMNAARLGFLAKQFDLVFCIQNGISAFKEDPKLLLAEAIRVAKPGGIVLFSSYSDKLWEDRLQWFRIQAEQGLVGEIDDARTRDGLIICKDGFKATTFSKSDFELLTAGFNRQVSVFEVDNSSIFCEIIA